MKNGLCRLNLIVYRVDDNYIVKIADFGMSRDVYEKDYYTTSDVNKPMPIRWMAVESMKEGMYSTKSDVVGTKPVLLIRNSHSSFKILLLFRYSRVMAKTGQNRIRLAG